MSMFWSATTAASSSGGIATSRVGAVAAELGDKVLSAAKAGDLSEIRKLLTAGVDKDFAGAGVCMISYVLFRSVFFFFLNGKILCRAAQL